jgi:predicted phosphodiesterase
MNNNQDLIKAIALAKQGKGRIAIAKELGVNQSIARMAVMKAKIEEFDAMDGMIQKEDFYISTWFAGFEDGIDDSIAPLEIEAKQVLIMGDIHFPRHDLKALLAAIDHGVKIGADVIYLNGDIMDGEKIARFSPSIVAETFKKEIQITREFLSRLREVFPKAQIFYKEGNHEKRFIDYILKNADELFDLVGMSLKDQLGLDGLGIVHVPENQIVKFGKLFVAHGHEYKSQFAGGIYHARNTRIKAGVPIAINHFHRTQSDIDRKLDGSTIAGFGIGCLCKLNPAWAGITKWNHGFADVEMSGENFHLNNMHL